MCRAIPYTLAHPAAIVPLHRLLRGRTSLSALAIGSMAPDFPYFLGGVSGPFSHSLPGFFLYCLPAGLVAYLLFHALLKQPSMALLPGVVASRLPAPPGRRALPDTSFAVVTASLALGALTHLLWNGFTHADTAIVEHVAILNGVVGTLGDHELRLFEALQYGCSILGLGALACWIMRWIRRTPARAGNEAHRLALVPRGSVFALMALAAFGACVAAGLRSIEASEAFLVAAIVNAMNGCGLVWIAYCLAWQAFQARQAGWRVAGERR